MAIEVGQRVPEGNLSRLTDDGVEVLSVGALCEGRKVVMVAMPGAFTGTCTALHLPSLVKHADALRAGGIDEVVVFTVNDVQVSRAWAEHVGAPAAGVSVLADTDGSFSKALGRTFDVPAMGFFGRAVRHVMVVDNGTVTTLQVEEGKGVCDMTDGAAILDLI